MAIKAPERPSIIFSVDGKEYGFAFAHNINNKGGMTVCWAYVDNKFVANAGAICADADQFNRKVGRKVAYGRVLIKAKFPRPVRAELWKAYFMSGIKLP